MVSIWSSIFQPNLFSPEQIQFFPLPGSHFFVDRFAKDVVIVVVVIVSIVLVVVYDIIVVVVVVVVVAVVVYVVVVVIVVVIVVVVVTFAIDDWILCWPDETKKPWGRKWSQRIDWKSKKL